VTRARLLAAGVAAAGVAVVVVVGAIALGGGAPRSETAREAKLRATVRTELVPRAHRFGELVRARAELLVPKSEIDLDTVKVSGSFDPYLTVGPTRRAIEDLGSAYRVRFTVDLQCLSRDCLPEPQSKEFALEDVRVTWATPAPLAERFKNPRLYARQALGTWPTLTVGTALTPVDMQEGRWRSSLATLPRPGTRTSSDWLSVLLLGAAVALVAAAAVLAYRWLRDALARRDAARVKQERELTPLERAVALLQGTNGDGDPERRRMALERLAWELRRTDAPDLAADAERLAWSESEPPAADIERLAEGVLARAGGAPA
jgi:hypothetical protein